ncbi:MAG: hypothetical protein JO264_09385 [Acidisphaera sp.]|nr:hypothetical protein [Acidisphaera sp.]
MSVPDPHGQAALLLCETLIHILLEKRVIDKDDLRSLLDTVLDVTDERADENPDEGAVRVLLFSMAQSLSAA